MAEVRDVMQQPVEVIGPSVPVLVMSLVMRERGIGFLPVCHGDEVLGVVTDRDIVTRCLAARLPPETTAAEEIMSVGPLCCFEDDDVGVAAARLEENGLRRLIVCDRKGRPVGVLSRNDLRAPRAVAARRDYEVIFMREIGGGRHATLARVRVKLGASREEAVKAACREFERERRLGSWRELADGVDVVEL